MLSLLKKIILGIYKLDPNVLSFLSGILVATSINILTSALPASFLTLDCKMIALAFLLLADAALLQYWTVLIKPCHEAYKKSKELIDMSKEELWKSTFEDKKVNAHPIFMEIIILLAICLFILCLVIMMI